MDCKTAPYMTYGVFSVYHFWPLHLKLIDLYRVRQPTYREMQICGLSALYQGDTALCVLLTTTHDYPIVPTRYIS